jgi:hypothetical protein
MKLERKRQFMDGVVVSDNGPEGPKNRTDRSDEKRPCMCGRTMHLLTVTTRLSNQPAYRVFECATCYRTEMIAIEGE